MSQRAFTKIHWQGTYQYYNSLNLQRIIIAFATRNNLCITMGHGWFSIGNQMAENLFINL